MSKWTLVTGANGFIGSHLVRALVERGHKVKALVRAGADLRQLEGLPTSEVRVAVGDLRIVDRVYAAMSSCDRVFHVAAQVSTSERDRAKIIRSSVEGTSATLEAARRAGIEKIVVTSSVFALGATDGPEPMDESHPFNVANANAYAEAKRAAEALALARAASGLPVVVVNPAMVVGPGDWRPTGTGQMLLDYLKTSPAFKVPVIPGGLNFVGVNDVVRGHILAMEKGRVGERYILGGEDLTYHQLYTRLSDITGLAEPGAELSRGNAQWRARWAAVRAALGGPAPAFSAELVANYFGRFLYVTSEKARTELGYTSEPVGAAFVEALRWYMQRGYVPESASRRVRLELQPA